MHVSLESPAQTRERLLRVIADAEFRLLEGAFAYAEYPIVRFPAERVAQALAFVRDEEVWSVLEPARADAAAEKIGVFAFHFAAGQDNSGFVGWLATHLKQRIGTGALVVCGSNSERGGIFDYWGVPFELTAAAVAEVRRLRGES